MRRRQPGCGWEAAHDPHNYEVRRSWDGTPLPAMPGDKPGPFFCTGWTADEAGLCVMLRQVQLAMIEKGIRGKRFRLEITGHVQACLRDIFIPDHEDARAGRRLDHLHGAEVVLVAGPAGAWRLAEVVPALAEGTVP